MLYHIKTFGCQMNTSDSERIAGFLESLSLASTENIAGADLIIFNTCGIRQTAEDRAYGQIHNIRKKEKTNKNQQKKIIILTGCLANRKDVQKRLKERVDLFCEIKNFQKTFPKILNTKPEILNNSCEDFSYFKLLPKYKKAHTAFVPIMTGCNNFCSYCVVPYARGREISRPTKEIIAEIKNLLKNGCREITLLGQNVNSYNHDKITFPKLLEKIEKIPGHFWIRFMSSHPKDFSDELIEIVTKSKKICEHIHLPIQAGDDKILERMNRGYTRAHYLNLIEKIKTAFQKNKPGKLFAISSDIIVGFPTETRKQFLESAKVLKKVGYDIVYFGQFSPRPGTVAYKLKDDVSKLEKSKREKQLNEILKKTAFSNNEKYLGKTLEILVDKEKDGFYFGRTRTQKDVKIHPALKSPSPINLPANIVGKFIRVKIIQTNIWNLEACLIHDLRECLVKSPHEYFS